MLTHSNHWVLKGRTQVYETTIEKKRELKTSNVATEKRGKLCTRQKHVVSFGCYLRQFFTKKIHRIYIYIYIYIYAAANEFIYRNTKNKHAF